MPFVAGPTLSHGPFGRNDTLTDSWEKYHSLHAESGEALTIPEWFSTLGAVVAREGSDLLIVAEDGSRILVVDYFSVSDPPVLLTPSGDLSGSDVIAMLATDSVAGRYAQLAPEAGPVAASAAIGKIEMVNGSVTVTRADGSVVSLAAGDPVFEGDVLESEAGAAVGLVFNDDSTFALGENGQLVLNELEYDPGTGEGSARFSVLEGMFVFASGQIAANNPEQMILATPVATINVRGAKVAGLAAAEGEQNSITMVPNANGTVGQIVVATEAGQFVLSEAYQPLSVSSAYMVPEPASFDQSDFEQVFATVLGVLPPPPRAPEEDAGGNRRKICKPPTRLFPKTPTRHPTKRTANKLNYNPMSSRSRGVLSTKNSEAFWVKTQ